MKGKRVLALLLSMGFVLSACGEKETDTETPVVANQTATYKEYDLEGLSLESMMMVSSASYNEKGELVVFTMNFDMGSAPNQGGSVNNKKAEEKLKGTPKPQDDSDSTKGSSKSNQKANDQRGMMRSFETWALTIGIDAENKKVTTGSSILAIPSDTESTTPSYYTNLTYGQDGKIYMIKSEFTGKNMSEGKIDSSNMKMAIYVLDKLGGTPHPTQVTDVFQKTEDADYVQVSGLYPFEDGTILITYENGKTRLYDTIKGILVKEYDKGQLDSGIYVDGNEIYALSSDGTKVEIIDKDSGEAFSETKIGDGAPIENEVAFTSGESGEMYMATHKGIYRIDKDSSTCTLVMPETVSQIMDLPSKKITNLQCCSDGSFAVVYRDSNVTYGSSLVWKLYSTE